LVETASLAGFVLAFCARAAFTAVFFVVGTFFEAAGTAFLGGDGFFTVLTLVFTVAFLLDEATVCRTGFACVFDEVFGAFFAAGFAVFLFIFPPKA
jgi:hypothetical protein